RCRSTRANAPAGAARPLRLLTAFNVAFFIGSQLTWGGPQPPGRVVHLLAQACGALGEAHQLGLIHRDIKPANLFLCQRPEEPDFGLVKHLNRGAHPSATDAHAVLGTPHYMAPEDASRPTLRRRGPGILTWVAVRA